MSCEMSFLFDSTNFTVLTSRKKNATNTNIEAIIPAISPANRYGMNKKQGTTIPSITIVQNCPSMFLVSLALQEGQMKSDQLVIFIIAIFGILLSHFGHFMVKT